MKICTKCKVEKDVNLFSNNKNYKDGKENICKKCHREYDQLNKEKQAIYHREKRIKEICKFKAYDKKYKFENKNKANLYNSKKWYNDSNYKLRKILRGRLYILLKINKTNKSQSALKLLGCTVEFFKNYLESQFLPEFTWENHGLIWEIDHIIPCSKFDLIIKENQEKCFHFSNMKPLFKTTDIAISYGYLDIIGNRNKSNKC